MPKTSVTHILLVDDHPVVRQGVATAIDEQPDLRVCAQASSHDEALEAASKHKADVALVDLRLEDGNGLTLVGELRKHHPTISSLVFSMHDDKHYAERALRAGARGYLMKHESTDTLLEAIRCVRDGNIYLRPEIAPHIMKRMARRRKMQPLSEMDSLSDREIEVLQFMAEGLNRGEIAEELGLSVKTIDSYRENLKKKLNLRDTLQLAQFAARTIESYPL